MPLNGRQVSWPYCLPSGIECSPSCHFQIKNLPSTAHASALREGAHVTLSHLEFVIEAGEKFEHAVFLRVCLYALFLYSVLSPLTLGASSFSRGGNVTAGHTSRGNDTRRITAAPLAAPLSFSYLKLKRRRV